MRPAISVASCTKGSDTASDQTCAPGATVTVFLPPKVSGRLLPATTAAPLICNPAKASSKVTGLAPKLLEKRNRILLPNRSGLMIIRKLCSWDPASGWGKAKDRSGCAEALPTG